CRQVSQSIQVESTKNSPGMFSGTRLLKLAMYTSPTTHLITPQYGYSLQKVEVVGGYGRHISLPCPGRLTVFMLSASRAALGRKQKLKRVCKGLSPIEHAPP